MIKSFFDKTARDIYDGIESRYSRKLPRELHNKARRLLDQINAAPSLEFLSIPPGSKWRIVFRWKENNFYDIQILDYH